MEAERWQALVGRLEQRARTDPAAHRRKLALVALLGYGFIAGLLVLLLGLAVVVVLVAVRGHVILLLKVLLPIAALLWVALRSLHVRFEAPEGVPLSRRDAPELHAMVDEVRRAVEGPRVHDVIVNAEPNAGVVQRPRGLGLLGSRNYLVLGLPYLHGLSANELRAVVAHELGHLSHAHGRFGAFVYRVGATWSQLLAGFSERGSMWTGLVRRFFEWYVPYFHAHALPLARAHEFTADEVAAKAAGAEAVASSLATGSFVAESLAESYWPAVFAHARESREPAPTALIDLAGASREAARGEDVERWCRRLLEVETDPEDTHPSPAERLEQLGLDPAALPRLVAAAKRQPRAAEAFLGATSEAIATRLQQDWLAEVAGHWASLHAEAQSDRAELERLDLQSSLAPDDALRRAQLTEDLRGKDDALERYRELLGGDNDAPARFAVGRLLLERGDDDGLRYLDEAMARDLHAVLPACEVAYHYLRTRERDDDAEAYRARAEQAAEMLEAAARERSEVSVEDRLEPADLPDELLERARRQVARHDDVAHAYLVRKRTEHLDETEPFYVLGVLPRSDFRTAWKDADDEREPLAERIARDLSGLPIDLLVVKLGKGSPLTDAFAASGRHLVGDD